MFILTQKERGGVYAVKDKTKIKNANVEENSEIV